MMMRRVWASLLLLIFLVAACVPALADADATGENMIQNGAFEQLDGNGAAVGWRTEAWQTGIEYTLFSIVADGSDGGNCAFIQSDVPNDARFVQRVAVEPNTHYRISCMVKAEGVGEGKNGAGISVGDTFVYSPLKYDSRGRWEKVALVGVTGSDQREIAVMARLGGYGSTNEGRAWFDEFHMEKIDAAAAEESVNDFSTIAPDNGAEQDDVDDDALDSGAGPVAARLALGLLFALMCTALIVISGRGRVDLSSNGKAEARLAIAILALGFVVRCVVALVWRGYEVDMNCFSSWSSRMASLGPAEFYAPKDIYFCDYPPGYMYVLWLIGALQNLLRLAYDTRLQWLLVKLPSILMDILAALMLYRCTKKPVGRVSALALCAMYALNPAAILNSAAWGQIDATLAMLVLLSMLLFASGKTVWALPVFAVSILVKPQALMLAPLGLLALVMDVAMAEHKGRAALRALLGVALALLAMLLLALPFIIDLHPQLEPFVINLRPKPEPASGFSYVVWRLVELYRIMLRGVLWLVELYRIMLRGVLWLIELYKGTLSSYPYITINACNLYVLLDKNWVALADVTPLMYFGWGMMGLSFLYSGFLYVKSRDKNKLFLVAALLLSLVFCFAPKMHERYLFPALILLLFAFVKDMDWRILAAFVALSFTQFMNGALVLRSEHLQSSEQVVNAGIALLNILGTGLLCWTGWDLCVGNRMLSITRRYARAQERASAEAEVRKAAFAEVLFRPRDFRMGLRPKDIALMLALTALYAALAFVNLGVTQAPQTEWVSSAQGEQITFELDGIREFHMAYYGGICNQNFKVQLSDDGASWSKEYYADYNQGTIFRWLWYRPMIEDEAADSGFSPAMPGEKYPLQAARFIRLTMLGRGMRLSEVAFLDAAGEVLPIASMQTANSAQEGVSDAKLLIDEQDTVPPYPSYLNSTYFDEIYHARTAYENVHWMHNYEWTHPPLGKLLIALGIEMFGMTPFGWRFMGALFGVLMVPLMYLLARQITKRTSLAFIAGFLMAVDCMHFTQTRIATIDSFAVFFIMLMYLFMFRYAQMSFYHTRLWRTLIPLGLCGITMGVAWATKWIGLYASAGLAVLLFFSLIQRWREFLFARAHIDEFEPQRKRVAQRIQKTFLRNLWVTLGFCVVFFIVIPLLIYYVSYYPVLAPDGNFGIQGVVDMQRDIFSYHAGLAYDDHGFKSPWYQWPVIAKPMWYYTGTDFMPPGWVSSISCMGNPVVFWGGLIALAFVIVRIFMRPRFDRRCLFVVIAFLSQYLPWILVPRSTFIYHYFASVPFIILATVLMFDWVRRKSPTAYRYSAAAYCVLALLLFAFFYPVCSGLPIPLWYARNLRWFNWINY